MRSEMKISRVVNPITCQSSLVSGHKLSQNVVTAVIRRILQNSERDKALSFLSFLANNL
jgi:hypothetical protein